MSDRAAPPRAPRPTLAEIAARISVLLELCAAAIPVGSCGKPRRTATPVVPAMSQSSPSLSPSPPPQASLPAPRGKAIVIAYSSNLLGEYEPCG